MNFDFGLIPLAASPVTVFARSPMAWRGEGDGGGGAGGEDVHHTTVIPASISLWRAPNGDAFASAILSNTLLTKLNSNRSAHFEMRGSGAGAGQPTQCAATVEIEKLIETELST